MTDKNRIFIVILLILGFFIYLAINQGWFSHITSGEAFSDMKEWFESDLEELREEKLPALEEKWSPQDKPSRLKHVTL